MTQVGLHLAMWDAEIEPLMTSNMPNCTLLSLLQVDSEFAATQL